MFDRDARYQIESAKIWKSENRILPQNLKEDHESLSLLESREVSKSLKVPVEMDFLQMGEMVAGYQWDLSTLELGEAKFLYVYLGEIQRRNFQNKKFPARVNPEDRWVEIVLED